MGVQVEMPGTSGVQVEMPATGGVMSALGTEGRCYGYSVYMLRVTCVHKVSSGGKVSLGSYLGPVRVMGSLRVHVTCYVCTPVCPCVRVMCAYVYMIRVPRVSTCMSGDSE